ncbi:MAG: HEAT repeat domain-containing protein [Planctomycetes bacterium]|nr:HEAT repeat domain-containing protein [Planctomycetota bacterium]
MMFRLQQLAILAVVAAAGYMAYNYLSGTANKTVDQLVTDYCTGNAVESGLAQKTLSSRAIDGSLPPSTFIGWAYDPDEKKKLLSLALIAKRPTKEGRKVALKLLNERSVPVRIGAVQVFQVTKSKEAVEPLMATMNESDADLSLGARSALEFITDQRFKETGKWKEWWDMNRATFTVTESD